MKISIDFNNRQEKTIITENIKNLISQACQATLTFEKVLEPCTISISFVEKKEIRELNRLYRSVDKETDVLSFPMEDDFNFENTLGDVVLCVERAQEQAEEYHHSLDRELSYLTVHSVLHLLGYDHIDTEDKSVMRRKEKEIMKYLGIFKNEEIQ